MKQLDIDGSEEMITFVVVSLFTRVPVKDAVDRGGSRQSPREGLSIKGPANLTYPHFQKHPDSGHYFSKRALFSFLKILLIFSNFINMAKGAPTTFLVIFLSLEDLKRP